MAINFPREIERHLDKTDDALSLAETLYHALQYGDGNAHYSAGTADVLSELLRTLCEELRALMEAGYEQSNIT